MAVVELHERPGRNGNVSANTTLERTYWLRTNDADDAAETIYFNVAYPIPKYGDAHPFATLLFVRDIDIRNMGLGLYLWEVRVTYESRQEDELETAERQSVPDPLDRRTRLRMQFAPFERIAHKDRNGKPHLNSANEPFINPLVIPDVRIRIEVTKNLTTWPAFLFSYRNKVNAADVTIRGITFEPRTLRFVPGDIPDFQVENGITFLPITFFLEHLEETWDPSILDAGTVYLDVDGNQKPIEVDGERPAGPVLLDGSGGVLVEPTADNAVYIDFETLEEADFSVLPLT